MINKYYMGMWGKPFIKKIHNKWFIYCQGGWFYFPSWEFAFMTAFEIRDRAGVKSYL